MSAMVPTNFLETVFCEGDGLTVPLTFGSINKCLIMKPKGQACGRTALGHTPSGKVCEALA
mgnify:CR=1 FL=1